MTKYEILSLSIGVATPVILAISVGLALRSLRADHERRKKQATFEFVQKIRPGWIEAKQRIEEKWGDEPLTSRELEEIDTDFQLLKLVRNLLGQLEHLSVGMNTGVFDKDLLHRMSGAQLISIYHRLHTYIHRAQKANPTVYIEFQNLVKDFENRKQKPLSTSGNIINS